MAPVSHPRIDRETFSALLGEYGCDLPLEHIDGEVVVTPPPGGWHAAANVELVAALHAWRSHGGDAGLLLSDVFLLVGDDTLGPDVAWWPASRRPEVPQGRVEGTIPDLVAEILSPETTANDLGPKRRAYLDAGVREYWVLDPDERTVLVERPPAPPLMLDRHAELTSPLLPGFAIAVARLFQR